MIQPKSRRLRIARWLRAFAGAITASSLASPASAGSGDGAALVPDSYEASHSVDARGLTVHRDTRRRTPFGLLYPFPLRPPSYREWGAFEIRGFLDVGFVGDAGEEEEARFREFSDYGEGFLLRSFELGLRQREGPIALELSGGAAGRHDEFYRGELRVPGRLLLSGFRDSLSHVYSDEARSLLAGVGSDTLVLPAGLTPGATPAAAIDAALALTPTRRITRERSDSGGDLRLRVRPDLELFASYRQQRHEGKQPFGGTLGITFNSTSRGSAIETLAPLDARTHEWSTGLAYAGEAVQANLAYLGSAFENEPRALTWENPFFLVEEGAVTLAGPARGRAALAPDNRSHRISGDVGIALPWWDGRFTTSASWALLRQDDLLLASTVNAALPDWLDPTTSLSREHAGAEVQTWLVRSTLRLRPSRRLEGQLRFRYSSRDNDTDYVSFNPALGSFGYVSEDESVVGRVGAPSFSQDRWSVEGNLRWRATRTLRLALELEHDELRRENRARERTRDDRVRVSANARAPGDTNLRIAYEFLHRGGSRYDPTRDLDFYATAPGSARPQGPARSLSEFRQSDLASRAQHQVDARASWLVGETGDVSLVARYRDADLKAAYGPTLDRSARFEADASYLPSPRLDLHAFGSFEWRARRQRSIKAIRAAAFFASDFSAGGPVYPLDNAWRLDSESFTFAIGAGLRVRPIAPLELTLDYTHLRSRENLDYAFASASAVPPTANAAASPGDFPSYRFTDQILDLAAAYQWSESIGTRLFYRLQYSTIGDFHQDGLTPRVGHNLFLAQVDDAYTAHVFGASATLRF